ncbi:O-antigen polymerase [Providencia alcalifaciens]|uniref:O-antigen ligase family protein n=1 Tax=Providencia alcalifaciens TaxID=126385 RepID=UPI001CE1C3BE|nr:O-antigen ligase family protein [Providencia alcalifaciens]UBX50322.1 O-antigen polymerase [Providencia alcalifaciens]
MTNLSSRGSTLIPSLHRYAPTLVLGLCLISLLLLPFRPDITSKIFNFAGIVAILIFFTSPKNYFKNKLIIIAAPLFLIGVTHLLWVELYKVNDSIYRNVYHGYFQMGKIALFGSFLLLIVNNAWQNRLTSKLYLITAIISQMSILGYASYQAFYLHMSRIDLAFQNASNATGAAYAIIFLSLYAQFIFLNLTTKVKYYLYSFSILMTFSCLILTGTRAGILLYPVISLIIFLLYSKKNKAIKLKFALIPIIIALIICAVFSKTITQRMLSASNEVIVYIKNESTSSIGDRLSMIQTGYYSSNGFLWQSAEDRNSKIIALAKNDKGFVGATKHMHAHLHNDLMETLSTKGWINGVLLLLLFYASIIIYGYKQAKNPFILGFALSLIGLGFSDTLVISTQVSLSWVLVLILICSCFPSKREAHS